MGTTRSDIRQWIERADDDATHMVVVCDEFDHEDYPVYVGPNRNVEVVVREYDSKAMSHVMEVYNLRGDIEAQLAADRAYDTSY
jgi:hypothetical protein